MRLNIENYKNISSLDLDIDDNKINFVFGISGSGKTSIGKSLCKEIDEDEIMIGKNIDDVKIKLNGKDINKENVSLYNEKTIDSLIIENNMNSNVYNIIFSNDSKIIAKKNEFQKVIKELSNFKDIMYQYIGKVDVLIKNYGGKLTVKRTLPASSKIIKFENALNNDKNKYYIEIIKNKEGNYLKWLNEGRDFKLYKDSKICPFCENKISLTRTDLIENLCDLTSKDFDIIFNDENILKELNIEVPNYSSFDELKALKDKVISKIKLKDELLKIISVIDYYIIDNYNPSNISIINVSDDFKREFPKISNAINSVNGKINELKKLLGELKQITDKTIHDNLKVLNDNLEKFGIPYRFRTNKYNIEEKVADYILYHIKDESQKHRINGLSYGEKNIISLLLFLMSNKSEIVIIDDPASSYDDYRRKIIFDLLYILQNDNTFIILSHDMVFVKYAVFNRFQGSKTKSSKLRRFFEKTGKVISFENYNDIISIKNIEYSDFNTIENQVMNHISDNKLSYFRKIINLRILTEIKKNFDSDYEIIYNYLSAIFHRKDKDIITKELENKGFNEAEIIIKINEKCGVKIDKIPDDILKDFNVKDLTNFEKIFYYRDQIREESIKDEFNNIIHMNASYVIALNPYKFNYFSPYVYEKINNWK